jgi:hypothetical protein
VHSGPWPPHCRGFTITLNDTLHSVGPLWTSYSLTQRPLPDSTHHSQETDIHAPGGIRTRNPSKRAAAESRLRPHEHWDSRWFLANIILLNLRGNFRLQLPDKCGPAKRSRYSDFLSDGRSGDRTPVGERYSAPVQTVPRAPTSLLYNGYRVRYPAVKRPGRGVHHPPPMYCRG